MAVYYKFKSARDYDSVPIDGQFISVANLKERIFESKHLGRGTDFDLMVSNAQTNEEYLDEAAMIPKNTSVLIRRIPGRPRKPIVTEPNEPKIIEDKVEDVPPLNSTMIGDSSIMKYPEESEWDEFGTDLYAIPEVTRAQTSNPVMDVSLTNKVDEDSKIKALIDTPALDWNRQAQDGYGAGRGFGRGMGGRMGAGRGFGRGGLERRTPPAGYVCHRCKVPGHFIQHCPTNGDPNFDLKRTKPPTGIPKSMLIASSDGSYALPTGGVAVLKPNEAAFEKEIEGLPTLRSVSDFPPELRCPLCKEVMKDAVLTSKCCFRSFCDKCIRDYIITKMMCVCGATNILADDLLPNKTLRETISRIMESATSSTENAGSLMQVPDMESARPAHPKVPSPTLSAASKDETKKPMLEHSSHIKEGDGSNETKAANIEMNSSDKKAIINENVSEAAPGLLNKDKSLETAPVAEDVQEKQPVADQGKKKKKKKMRIAGNASDMQWKGYQDLGAENFGGMPLAAPGFNPYWSAGMPLAMDPYMPPFGGGPMPFMNYAPTPFDPFGGMLPHDPFVAQNYMMPVVSRDLSEMGMPMNQGPPVMSREEFEARKAELRRKREMERRNEREREFAKDRETRKESSSINDSPLKSKPRPLVQPDRPERLDSHKMNLDRHGPTRDSLRHSPHRPSKRKSSDRDDPPPAPPLESSKAAADRKQKASVFSRISFPDSSKSGEAAPKKRKASSSSELPPKNGLKEHRESSVHKADGYYNDWKGGKGSTTGSRRGGGNGGGGGGGSGAYDHESSEEEYHFKRRPSSSSRRDAADREEGRASKGSREREPHERGSGREHDHYHERPSSKRR